MQAPQAYVEDEDVVDTGVGATRFRRGSGNDSSFTQEVQSTLQDETAKQRTIVVKTHDGDGYVIPHLPWQATKAQIGDIYKTRHREKLAEAVKDGKFSILTTNGDIVLPSLWNQVVMPSSTVQIVLPSDILNADIASYYPDQDEARPVHRSRRSSFVRRENTAPDSDVEDAENIIETISAEVSDSDEESDFESMSSGSELSEASIDAESLPELSRRAVTPVDGEGNNLNFQVNTTLVGPMDRVNANTNDDSSKREPQQHVGNAEFLGITKAVTAQAEGRTRLQLHILPGPRSVLSQHETSVRWYHLQSERLDFTKFKETCLGIPGHSERLRKLLRKLFERIEEDKVKIFLGGMFIEPGTVLRADESHQSDPQSIIFSCVPYFDLHASARNLTTAGKNNLFASRTLMQSYYPYEPVEERDAEQAYRLFGNEQHNALVHVPNIWVLNIGSNIVATCGHQALSKSLVQSIEVCQAGFGTTEKTEDQSPTIRLIDWDGNKLLYTVQECRSYFQMEQKLRELRWCSGRFRREESLQLSWQISGKSVKVTPELWPSILRQRDALFIDLSLNNDSKEHDKDQSIPQSLAAIIKSSLPFFQWPQLTGAEELKTDGFTPEEVIRSTQRLELVEKAMLSEVLSSEILYSAVEETFTSTAYYRGLPENTAEHTWTSVKSLSSTYGLWTDSTATGLSFHQTLINKQRRTIAERTTQLCGAMQSTLLIFVANVDNTTMLRKLWAAMHSICTLAKATCGNEPVDFEKDKQSGDQRTSPSTAQQGWYIRADMGQTTTSDSLKKFSRTFERCRSCKATEMYDTSQAALQHLQKHLKYLDASEPGLLNPERWIASYAQMRLESWDSGVVAILTTACYVAQQLFNQANELSDGTRNEDGRMSDLYQFPRPLLSAFRQLLVFYFAIERALHYTVQAFDNGGDALRHPRNTVTLPFSSSGLQVLEAFGNGVQLALASARNDLCAMVKSKEPVEIFKRLSLSPEYVCSWFMRRLIVKPLEKSMTVSDMYREYLSTIQFQVNHRPSKRLLRSINLLQEELSALQEVNAQQRKLISNYTRVLDDATYEKNSPVRRAIFPYERMLLASCLDSLQLTDQEYRYLLARCGPLSDSTKQSLEINEEDHGKAIMVFTIVTVIFLPLSFVTSFLGMNTTDIRDMGSSSTLFWAIAIPLTATTMGSVLYIGYNGDDLRDAFSALYRIATGKQDRSTSARGISVVQRKQARKAVADSSTTLDFNSLADEAEFANPQSDNYYHTTLRTTGGPLAQKDAWQAHTLTPPVLQWEPYVGEAPVRLPRNDVGTNLRKPTFAKIHRENLEVETLHYYNIPYEYDVDPDYIIVLREMSLRELEILFEHTRRLQSHQGDRLYVEADDRDRRGKKEYAYVPKKPSVYAPPTDDAPYVSVPHRTTARPDDEYPEVQTYNEPIVLESRRTRRRYSPSPSSVDRYRVPPPQYEWTKKKSHRNHRSARERVRRTRDEGGSRWNDKDDLWHPSGARHVPVPGR